MMIINGFALYKVSYLQPKDETVQGPYKAATLLKLFKQFQSVAKL